MKKKQKELDVQLIFVDSDKREVLDVMPTKKNKKINKQASQTSNVVSLEAYKTVTREEIK